MTLDSRRLGVATVFHPGSEPFAEAFVESVQRQTDSDFIFLVLVDGVSAPEFGDLQVEVCRAASSISENRKRLLRRAQELELEFTVFADSDDLMAPERVARIQDVADDTVDVISNDWVPLGSAPKEQEPSFLGALTAESFRDGCPIGLGASAVRTAAAIPTLAGIDDACEVFDWALFTLMAQQGARFRHLPESLTHYRQHAESSLQLSLQAAVQKKASHYRLLKHAFPDYEDLGRRYGELACRLSDPVFCKTYTETVRGNQRGWWFNLTLPEIDDELL